ncbi:hypothetical protein K8S19_12760 [bacterium]|nr:hypothetical protein [bacterium]
MSCKQYSDQWEAYTLGLLAKDKKSEMTAHLETCTACQAELRQHQQAKDLLDRAFVEGPSDVLVQKTLARLREKQAQRSSWLHWGMPVMAGAAVALLMVVIRPGQLTQKAVVPESMAPAMLAMEMDDHGEVEAEMVMTARVPMMKAAGMKKEHAAGPRQSLASVAGKPVVRSRPNLDVLDIQLLNPISDRSIYEDLGVATDVAKLLL